MAQQKPVNEDFKSDVKRLSWQLRLFVAAMNGLDRIAPRISTSLMFSKFVSPRRKKDCDYKPRLPAGARRITVQHNRAALAGWAWDGPGPAVLVIHGWESHTGRMIPLIRPLLAQGYRVFALDAPGHGLSPKAQTDLLDVGQAIQAMMEQHGPFYGVIAHSFGAAATAVLLAREPQLTPQKLALLSPMGGLDQHVEIFSSIARLSPQRKERLKARIADYVGLPLEGCSTAEAARALGTPGLVIHDRDDRLIPFEVGTAVAHNWRGAHFVATDRLGHRRGLGNGRVAGVILDFLTADLPDSSAAHHLPPRASQRTTVPQKNKTQIGKPALTPVR